MTDQIRVARLVAPGAPFEVGVAPMPSLGSNDVLVQVMSTNVVPNVSNVTGGKAWYRTPDLPAIFGLDAAGVITAVGPGVVHLQVGDRVYVDPFLSCGECRACRRGRQYACAYSGLRGYINFGPFADKLQRLYPYGGMSQFLNAPASKCAKLPDSIDFDTAARLGYLGTTYAALVKCGVAPGSTLLINGVTGTLGVCAVQMALGMGARRILGIGRNKAVMARVKALAPDRIDVTDYEGDPVEWAMQQTSGRGVDAMYDCLGAGGSPDTTNSLLGAVTSGGRCILVAGGVDGDISLAYVKHIMHPVHVTGSAWFTSGEIDDLVELIGAGIVDLSGCETRAFTLDQINDAIALAGSRPGGFVNVVVHPANA